MEYANAIRDIVVDPLSYSRATGDEDARRVELEPVIEDALRLVSTHVTGG